MLEWMLGSLVAVILIGKILDYLGLIDLLEVIGAVLRLTARLLFEVAAFFVLRLTRRGGEEKSS
jgi:hypothetical protein